MGIVFLSFPINLPIQSITQCKILALEKNEYFWISFVDVFPTFQFFHLAREKISQKTHKSIFFTNCKILASEKIEDFLDLLCEYLLNFSVLPPSQRENFPKDPQVQSFLHQLQKFCLRKKLKISWILFVSVFSTSQFSA